ncbi:MAG: glycosyltransferase family 4 protein [Candidatus Auribacterota bacterium]|nr:glycosyltransferase family 4 protein [Candidatus Auribacterota bacterium]
MNIQVIIPDKNAPSCRFRVLQYREPLRSFGITLEVVELSRERQQRRATLDAAADYDAVFLHRKLLNRFDYARLRRRARKLIYDFDDAVMFRDSNASRLESRMRKRKWERLVSGADLVIAGNEYLADFAGEYNNAVSIIPTVIDLDYFPGEPVRTSELTIGWMGTASNFIYLSLIKDSMEVLLREHPKVTFKVVSDQTPELPGLSIESKRWSASEELSDLAGFDIGIMPIFDDPWARGKCAFKIIQYFASYLPVVCSPVGANREVVEEGVNGYFASSPDEWRRRMEELLASAGVRKVMGRAGRKVTEDRYSLSVMAPRLARVLKETVIN